MTTLYFYTKKDCPLCEEGWIKLKHLQRSYHFQMIERDIYTNDDWLEKYQIRIPVVEDQDGHVLAEGMISSFTLQGALEAVSLKNNE